MLAEIAARLEGHACPPLVSIGMGQDLVALGEGTAAPDRAAYVVPISQDPEPNERATGPVLQRVRVTFAVAVCVRRYGDAKGSDRVSATDEIDAALESALLGWQPRDEADPITLVGIRSSPAKNGVLWHVSTWETARWAQAN